MGGKYNMSDETLKKEITALLKDLISISSSETIKKYIITYLENIGIEIEKLADSSILAKCGEGEQKFLIHTQFDTSVVGNPEKWSYPPFEPTTKENNIFGKGSSEFKCGLTSVLTSFSAISKEVTKLNGQIYLLCTSNNQNDFKEIKGIMNKDLLPEFDGGVIIEPTNLMFSIVQKGSCSLVLRIKGEMSHAACPWYSSNPVMIVDEILRRVQNMWPSHPIYPLSPKKAPPDLVTVFALGTSTVIPVNIRSEDLYGLITDELEIEFYVSLSPEQNESGVQRIQEEMIDGLQGFKFEWEIPFFFPPLKFSNDSKVIKVLQASYKNILGHDPYYEWFPWPTAASILSQKVKRKDLVIFGPGNFTLVGRPNESGSIDQVLQASKILTMAIRNL